MVQGDEDSTGEALAEEVRALPGPGRRRYNVVLYHHVAAAVLDLGALTSAEESADGPKLFFASVAEGPTKGA